MSAVSSVAVIGGGLAGFATAILLAEAGVAVDLVEISPDVAAVGSGITLQGNALRVLRRLGVWEDARHAGYGFDTLGLRAPDGTVLAVLQDARTGGPDLPATLGMYRPDLARLLADRATALGVKVRTGTAPESLVQDGTGVELATSDGGRTRYDLVVGADGVRSWTRRALDIDVEPQGTGMGIWRAFTTRPGSVERTDLAYGGPAYIAGYCPTGPDSIYAYVVEDAQDRSGLDPDEQLATMRALAGRYGGAWPEITAGLTDPSRVHYTRFETHLLDGPWHRGRVVLVGDAAHSCPPTVAQGGAMALEDGAVLAEVLLAGEPASADGWDALLTTYADRRLARVRTVVDASLQIGRWMLAGERGDVPGLMHRVADLVTTQP